VASTFSEPPGGPMPPPRPIPWEEPGRPAIEGLIETARLFFLTPTQAFQRMPVTSQLVRPLLYAVIFGWIGTAVSQMYGLMFRGMLLRLLPGFEDRAALFLQSFFQVGAIFTAPIWILIGLFIGSAINHVFLLMLGGGSGGFTGTLRVNCYAGTVTILPVIPLLGGPISGIWFLVLQVIGFAVVHRVSHGKALVAVLLPTVLCCGCVLFFAMVMGAATLAALGLHGN
jgi:hypothetical protein